MGIALTGSAVAEISLPEWKSSDSKKYDDPGSAPLGVGLWPSDAKVPTEVEDFRGGKGSNGASRQADAARERNRAPFVFRTDGSGAGSAQTMVKLPSGPVGKIEFTPMQQVSPTVQIQPVPGESQVSVEETIRLYFERRPLDFLVDPMALLTEQKSNDVSRFIEYHSEGAPYDICLIVMRESERVPSSVDLAAIHRKWFGEERVALVVYPYGHPREIQFEFGPDVEKSVSRSVLGRIEQSCVAEASIGYEPSDQVERLSIELSIRLYWLSRILDRPHSMSEAEAEAVADQHGNELVGHGHGESASGWAALSRGWICVLAAVAFLVLIGVMLLVRWLGRRNSLHGGPLFFPDRELPVRLGGVSSGGFCTEMSFQFGAAENTKAVREL